MMNNKKISFVTYAYIDNNFTSGGVKLNYILCKGLKEYGYQIDLFCDKLSIKHSEIFNNLYTVNEFENVRCNYDIIISDKACIVSDVTYIHDHSYPYRASKMSNNFSYFLYKILCRKHHQKRLAEFFKTRDNILKCKRVIVSSKVLKSDIVNNYGVDENRIIIIPPPVEKYAIHHTGNIVFTFGISAIGFERKGGYILLKAIRVLKNKNIDFKVKFIYPSNNLWVKFLVRFYGIEDICEFLPAQENMGTFYNSIDALVMPSIIEPFGMVAAEALACGCPVVTASHCGVCDIITDGINGIIYNENSETALAVAMQRMLEIENFGMMVDKAAISVENMFEKDFVKKYLELLETIL